MEKSGVFPVYVNFIEKPWQVWNAMPNDKQIFEILFCCKESVIYEDDIPISRLNC